MTEVVERGEIVAGEVFVILTSIKLARRGEYQLGVRVGYAEIQKMRVAVVCRSEADFIKIRLELLLCPRDRFG